MPEEKHGIEILGQKLDWPTTWASAVAAILVVATLVAGIAGILYITLVVAKTSNIDVVKGIIFAGVYDRAGNQEHSKPKTIYRCWTPNKNTKRIHLGLPLDTPEEQINKTNVPAYYWVTDKDEPEIHAFINQLSMHNVAGFDYYEAHGKGTTSPKVGYVWDITVDDQNPLSRKTFINLYATSWNRTNNIWLEEYHVSSERFQQE